MMDTNPKQGASHKVFFRGIRISWSWTTDKVDYSTRRRMKKKHLILPNHTKSRR